MSKTKILEEAYFHINNGGLSFSIKERLDNASREDKTTLHTYYLCLGTSHFGIDTEYRIPLPPSVMKWLQYALNNTLKRIEKERPALYEPHHRFTDVSKSEGGNVELSVEHGFDLPKESWFSLAKPKRAILKL